MPRSTAMTLSPRERRLGYAFALAAITIFSLQDGISKHLGQLYPPVFVTMIRYWAFAGFALVLAQRVRGGIPATAHSKAPWLQIARGALLALQIVLAITCFAVIGLARTQAIFAATPLVATVLSVVILGERASPLRWGAVLLGFLGVLLILKPHGDFFDMTVLLAVLCAFMFAVYVVLTRMAGRLDPPLTSFFYTGVAGCAVICLIGPFYWSQLAPLDWGWMATLCLTSVTSHYLLIKAYNILDASAVQPLSYLSVVYASIMGPVIFHETVHLSTYAGAAIVVAAGLASIWSEPRTI
ncbi:DMT family transporter [Aestuariivirga sp.]|uniref:DMT family transporter n=1 Tax=Aestuariivirga sp. TaxID=2650926 RepID=UPI003BAA9B85